MLSSLPPYILYIAAIICAAAISLYAVKKILFIARERKIYDIPDNIRKIHGEEIPSLGGIGVFVGYIATIPFFITQAGMDWVVIITSTVILFFTGIYDDLMNMRPSKKLLAQFIASFITVRFADIRILWLPGIETLPYWLSIGLTTFLCTFFINVFNFIDGIDGLACMSGILYCGVLAALFITTGHTAEACISLCLVGATIGLLYFNYAPAKIYMGDTGSMLSGFSIFILTIFYVRFVSAAGIQAGIFNASVLAAAILFYPVFDALRVFALRIKKGISPLHADRRHLHYYLLDTGMSHTTTAWLIVLVNALTIGMTALLLHVVAPPISLALIALPSVLLAIFAQARQKQQA